MTKEQRSRNMSAIRSKGNRSTEVAMRLRLVRAGIRGWRIQPKDVDGRPDFVFDSAGLAVFVDGCYWHGCPRCYRAPEQNSLYWQEKIARNQARDQRVSSRLRHQGWSVMRIWEHTLKKKPAEAMDRLRRKLAQLGGLSLKNPH
ncbi:MAG: very short patch repair endonuclease [Bryobacterales bacterium]|nr:very short patch repair endonuclease [Bryobacterales bacterium]